MGTGDKIYFHRDCIEFLNRDLTVPSDRTKIGADYIQSIAITRQMNSTFSLKEFAKFTLLEDQISLIQFDITKAERGPVKFCYLPLYTTKGMYKKLRDKKDKNQHLFASIGQSNWTI